MIDNKKEIHELMNVLKSNTSNLTDVLFKIAEESWIKGYDVGFSEGKEFIIETFNKYNAESDER